MNMLSLRKPNVESLRQFLIEQAKIGFNYAEVGATAAALPAGYVIDRTRIKLGQGELVFRSAQMALQRWEQFQLGWVEAWPADTPIAVGQPIAVMGKGVGLWWLNACRIVYVVEESTVATETFGFAYGTLPFHIERGEERFCITWDRTTDDVWYDILAFSKPNHLLARLGYPYVRRSQKQFGHDSATAMFRAIRPTTRASVHLRMRCAGTSRTGVSTPASTAC